MSEGQKNVLEYNPWIMHRVHALLCFVVVGYTDGLAQDCSNSSALALELLQPCTKPWMYILGLLHLHYAEEASLRNVGKLITWNQKELIILQQNNAQ